MQEENLEKLNALINRGADRHDMSSQSPNEDTVFACLEGKATPEQLSELQNALRNSRAFRREFKALVEDFQAFSRSAQFLQGIDGTIVPSRLKDKLQTMQKSSEATGMEKGLWLFRFLKTFFSARITQFALVGVVAALILLLRTGSPVYEVQWTQPSERIEKVSLRSATLRGGINERFETAKDAAMREFSKLLDYDDVSDMFVPKSQERYNVFSRLFGTAKAIDIVDTDGEVVGSIFYKNDQIPNEGSDDLQLWSLNLDKMTLTAAQLEDVNHSIKLTSQFKSTILLAITYQHSGKYSSLGGIALSPETR